MAKRRKIEPVNPEETVMALYRAVAAYIEARKGSVMVAGGITLIQWPHDLDYEYTLGIKCVGRKPTMPIRKEKEV